MTTPINDGGPAFPTVDANRSEDYGTYGMTLRDYFAAKAMQGYIVGTEAPAYGHIAKVAYEMADAMIKARAA